MYSLLCQIFSGPLTIFAENSILHVLLGSQYAHGGEGGGCYNSSNQYQSGYDYVGMCKIITTFFKRKNWLEKPKLPIIAFFFKKKVWFKTWICYILWHWFLQVLENQVICVVKLLILLCETKFQDLVVAFVRMKTENVRYCFFFCDRHTLLAFYHFRKIPDMVMLTWYFFLSNHYCSSTQKRL